MRPLTTANLRGQAVEMLRASIVAGELEPGEIYSAPALAERLGVSATPVREAMLDLAKDGLVEPVRNRGFRIVSSTMRRSMRSASCVVCSRCPPWGS